MNEVNNNLKTNQDNMLNKECAIDMNNSQNHNHINNEELINAYIGKGAEKIRKGKFSLWTCLFGNVYIFYRKMWLLGFTWCLINIFMVLIAAFITLKVFNIVELLQSSTYSTTTIVVFVSSCIVNVIISFLFNKLYIKKSEKKVEKIKQENSNKTNEELKKICAKKGGTTVIGIVLAIILSGMVETISEPILEKIISNEMNNKLAKETAYSIISSVEYAYTEAFLTSGKDTLTIDDIKNEYNGLSSTWNKDNTITSKHYDVVCNVTVNNDNKMQVSCDVFGEKVKSELFDLKFRNNDSANDKVQSDENSNVENKEDNNVSDNSSNSEVRKNSYAFLKYENDGIVGVDHDGRVTKIIPGSSRFYLDGNLLYWIDNPAAGGCNSEHNLYRVDINNESNVENLNIKLDMCSFGFSVVGDNLYYFSKIDNKIMAVTKNLKTKTVKSKEIPLTNILDTDFSNGTTVYMTDTTNVSVVSYFYSYDFENDTLLKLEKYNKYTYGYNNNYYYELIENRGNRVLFASQDNEYCVYDSNKNKELYCIDYVKPLVPGHVLQHVISFRTC